MLTACSTNSTSVSGAVETRALIKTSAFVVRISEASESSTSVAESTRFAIAESVPAAARWNDRDEDDSSLLGFGPPDRRRDFFGRGAPPIRIDSSPLAHVVGVILGSPEFQRR